VFVADAFAFSTTPAISWCSTSTSSTPDAEHDDFAKREHQAVSPQADIFERLRAELPTPMPRHRMIRLWKIV